VEDRSSLGITRAIYRCKKPRADDLKLSSFVPQLCPRDIDSQLLIRMLAEVSREGPDADRDPRGTIEHETHDGIAAQPLLSGEADKVGRMLDGQR
jgi:hypothetical protein